MKRGEIWTQAGGPGYARKPRPVLILQSDRMQDWDSVVIALFTSHDSGEWRTRLPFAPSETNGLHEPSDLMADKIMTVPRDKLGKRIGRIENDEMLRVEQALLLVLGFEA